jgi:hypothetical protein
MARDYFARMLRIETEREHPAAPRLAGFCLCLPRQRRAGPRMLARIAKHTGLTADDM